MVATGEEIERLHAVVREVPAAENVIDYATRLVRATRPSGPAAEARPTSSERWVRWGAGPRAGQALLLGAKARALLDGPHASLRSRTSGPSRCRFFAIALLVNFQAEADGIDADQIVTRLLDAIPADQA